MRDRLEAQNQKRRTTKGAKKGAADEGTSMPGGPRKTPAAKSGATRKVGEGEETLLAMIQDLQNDLKIRDEEFEQTRAHLDKLTEQNNFLKTELLQEKRSKITIEAKLNKII